MQCLHLITVLMECILTNNMLLGNTRSVAKFIPRSWLNLYIFLSQYSSLHRWCPSSWRSILYHFSKCRLYSSPPIWWSPSQAACRLTLWWQWSNPMASTLQFLSQSFSCYPPPQHVVWPPDHLVDTKHRWFQLHATRWAHVWFRETLSAKI